MHLSTFLSIALAASGLVPATNAETLKEVWQRLAPVQFQYLTLDPANNAWFSNPSNLTIFASADEAYVRFAMDPASIAIKNLTLLHENFNYLQVPGAYNSTDFSGNDLILKTNLTDPAFVNNTEGAALIEVTKIGKSFQIFTGNPFPVNVISADNFFDGGVLHLVDYIVPAPQNLTYTSFYRNISALAQFALLKPELSTARDVTIFVPSNEALAALGKNLTLDDVNRHCVPNNATYTPLLKSTVTSLKDYAGNPLTLTKAENGSFSVNGIPFSAGANYTVDNLLLNGVAHVIDGVLAPSS